MNMIIVNYSYYCCSLCLLLGIMIVLVVFLRYFFEF